MKKKPLHLFSLFCSVCKAHVEVHAEDKKQAEGKFGALGHQTIKVKQLRRGTPGILTNGNGETPIPYRTRKQEREHIQEEQRIIKKKRRGSKVVAMQEERLVEEAHGS